MKIGDKVTTKWFPNRQNEILTVVNKERPAKGTCQSGWMITAQYKDGNYVTADMGWFKLKN